MPDILFAICFATICKIENGRCWNYFFLCSSNARFNLYSFFRFYECQNYILLASFQAERKKGGRPDKLMVGPYHDCVKDSAKGGKCRLARMKMYIWESKKTEKILKKYFFVFDATVSDGELYRVVPNFWPIWVHLQQIWFDQKRLSKENETAKMRRSWLFTFLWGYS